MSKRTNNPDVMREAWRRNDQKRVPVVSGIRVAADRAEAILADKAKIAEWHNGETSTAVLAAISYYAEHGPDQTGCG